MRVGTIADGTSNTILFGETTSGPVCVSDVQVEAITTTAATPEPASLVILGLSLAGLGLIHRRRAG